MDARQGTLLVIPEWYSDRRVKDRMPVPQASKSFVKTDEFEVPRPPEPALDILQEQFVLKSSKDDRWLLANEQPGKMWPALRAYWEEQGAIVREVDAGAGIMEVELRDSSFKSKRYLENTGLIALGESVILRASVEQGIKRRSSEIRVKQKNAGWMDEKLLNTVLSSISRYMTANADSLESYSLVAQNIGGRSKLSLENEGQNDAFLRVDLSFDRVWHAVGEALAKGNVAIIDWNRDEGRYYVNYVSEESQEGWFQGLFEFGGRNQLSEQFNFIIQLNPEADGVHVFSQPTSASVDSQDRLRLLNKLLDNMS